MMALDVRSTRARPRDVVKVVTRGRPAVRAAQAERILALRARGHREDRIARELRIDLARVEGVIAAGRRAGDPRALTDQQAARAAAQADTLARFKASAELPVAPAPVRPAAPSAPVVPRTPPRVLRSPTFAAGEAEKLAAYVAMCRGASERVFPTHPDAAACYGHLADLFEHCPTAYPTYVLRDTGGHATLDSTDRQFPRRALVRSLTSSPGEMCAAG